MFDITLMLDKTYVDENKKLVKLVHRYAPGDTEYEQGFRYRGSDGFNYTEDGTVVGHVNGSDIFQTGASPLIAEDLEGVTHLDLQEGNFYRNGLGQVVMIIDRVPEDSRFYDKGYRFVDDRGTFYKPSGVTESKGMFAVLNIISPVPIRQVPNEDMNRISANISLNIARLDRRDRVYATFGRAKKFFKNVGKPLTIGAAIGVSAAAAIARVR